MAQDQALTAVVCATRTGVTKRSLLYRWMRANHDALASAFAENGPGWDMLLAIFAEAGLHDRSGKPPTKRVAQNTWYRVKRDVREYRAHRAAARQPELPIPAGEAASVPAAASPPPPPPHVRRVMVPCEPGPAREPGPPEKGGVTAEEAMALLRRTLNERSGR